MTDYLNIFLPVYFSLLFGIAFVAKTWIVYRKTNKNPLVLPKDNTPQGIIGRYFKMNLAGLFIYTFTYSYIPEYDLLPFQRLELIPLKYAGIILLLISLFWIVIAQNQMKNSWRIGIDSGSHTSLVTKGLFSISRNPIFLGMIVSLVGLFLLTPNALTLLFLVTGYMLIQIQIRMEEEYLISQHGEHYIRYQQTTKRLI